MALFDRLFGERYAAAKARKRRHQRVGVSTTAQRAADLLRSTTALIQLSAAEALTVVAYMELRRCAEGETIIRQGHRGGEDGFMALVIEGEITVEAVTVSRTEPLTVNVLGPGNLMGEMSLMDGERPPRPIRLIHPAQRLWSAARGRLRDGGSDKGKRERNERRLHGEVHQNFRVAPRTSTARRERITLPAQ
eukprot:gene44172-58917_t